MGALLSDHRHSRDSEIYQRHQRTKGGRPRSHARNFPPSASKHKLRDFVKDPMSTDSEAMHKLGHDTHYEGYSHLNRRAKANISKTTKPKSHGTTHSERKRKINAAKKWKPKSLVGKVSQGKAKKGKAKKGEAKKGVAVPKKSAWHRFEMMGGGGPEAPKVQALHGASKPRVFNGARKLSGDGRLWSLDNLGVAQGISGSLGEAGVMQRRNDVRASRPAEEQALMWRGKLRA